jgi:Tol biopolymer transport system component
VQLSPAPPEGTYVVPASWSPDGKTLVATIYSASSDQSGSPTESVELFTYQPDSQEHVHLAGDENARFLGWVVD